MFEQEWTPETLVQELKKTVVGQERYLKDLCTAVWMHSLKKKMYERTGEVLLKPKTNMLVLGKSGTGKTLTVQRLAKLLDLNLVIEDASQFTGAGWKGREVSSIVKDVIESADGDNTRADYSIVVLDEIDKVFGASADPTFAPVNNFLKLIEGADLSHLENSKYYQMETSNLLFVCLGAFDGLEEIIKKRLCQNHTIGFRAGSDDAMPEAAFLQYAAKEDLLAYGMNPQLLGRFALITATNELTAADYEQILLHSDVSAVKQYDTLPQQTLGVRAAITETAAKIIAEKAAQENTGARAVMAVVTEHYKDGLYRIAEREDVNELRLDGTPEGGLELQLVHGKRETAGSAGKKPLMSLTEEELETVPLEMDAVTVTAAMECAERIVEKTDRGGSWLSANHRYRLIRAAVYALAGRIYEVAALQLPKTLLSIQQRLYDSGESFRDADAGCVNPVEPKARLFQKAKACYAHPVQTIRLALQIADRYGVAWLNKHGYEEVEIL